MSRLGHTRPAAPQPAALGHRPLQSALPLLHARGRVPLAAARGRPHVRRDQPPRGSVRRSSAWTGCASPAASRCFAATCPHARRRSGRADRGCATSRSRPTACCWRTRRPTSSAPACIASPSASTRCSAIAFTRSPASTPCPRCSGRHRGGPPRRLPRPEARHRVTRGDNDDELVALVEFAREAGAEIRFIEYMDVGGATAWRPDAVVSRQEMLRRLSDHYGRPEAIRPGLRRAGRALPPAGRPDVRHHLVDDAAVLPDVRPRAAHGRRRAAALPLRAARHRFAAAAARRRLAKRRCSTDPRRVGRPRRPRRRRTPGRARPRRLHSAVACSRRTRTWKCTRAEASPFVTSLPVLISLSVVPPAQRSPAGPAARRFIRCSRTTSTCPSRRSG